MNTDKFNIARNSLNDHCEKLLGTKKDEYATGEDRLEQFKKQAILEGCHPVRSCTGLMAKHETSIHDMAKAVDNGESFDHDKWIEKIGDLRNYCDLLYALLTDEGEI